MVRSLALAVSLFAFSGLAAADCSDGHSQKDVTAPTGTVLASQAPTGKAIALPAGKQAEAKPAATKTVKAPGTKERTLVASQAEAASPK